MVIWKYPVSAEASFYLELPEDSEILDVQVQGSHGEFSSALSDVVVWALVDPETPRVKRTFRVVATGEPFEADGLCYLGTFQPGRRLVFHLFEYAKGLSFEGVALPLEGINRMPVRRTP